MHQFCGIANCKNSSGFRSSLISSFRIISFLLNLSSKKSLVTSLCTCYSLYLQIFTLYFHKLQVFILLESIFTIAVNILLDERGLLNRVYNLVIMYFGVLYTVDLLITLDYLQTFPSSKNQALYTFNLHNSFHYLQVSPSFQNLYLLL